MSLLKTPAGYCYVIFEVLTEVTVKNAVFWDVAEVSEGRFASIIKLKMIRKLGGTLAVSSCKNRRFGIKYCLQHQSEKISELGTLALTIFV
jgi:hypothetical protein